MHSPAVNFFHETEGKVTGCGTELCTVNCGRHILLLNLNSNKKKLRGKASTNLIFYNKDEKSSLTR